MKFFKRQSVLPFETSFGFFCVYNGIIAILNIDPVINSISTILGYKLSLMFNLAFIFAGLMLFFGLGLARRNVEAFGLILLITFLTIRIIVVIAIMNITAHSLNTCVQSMAFLIACAVRCYSLFAHKTIVETRDITFSNKISNDDKRILHSNSDN